MAKMAGEKMANVILRWAKSSWEDTINLQHEDLQAVYQIWAASINWEFLLMEEEGNDNIDYYIALETHTDMEASTLLALSGFYRHANSILRGWLELTFLGLWFYNSPELYEKWLEDASDAPFEHRGYFRESWLRQILSEPSFRDFEQKYRLSKEALDVYERLSKATHAKGKRLHETYTRGDSITRFRRNYFKQWFRNLCSVFDITSTILFLRYPNLFKSWREEATKIRETLSDCKMEQLREHSQHTT